jgi:hypothetical protein
MAHRERPRLTTDADFRGAMEAGDDAMQRGLVAAAAAYYQKATAIATWRVAGRVHLIESAVIETADAFAMHGGHTGPRP